MASTSRPHIVLSSSPAWSHLRTLCAFAAKLAAERSVTVTLLVPHWMDTHAKAHAETNRCFREAAKDPRGDIRVIALGEHSTTFNPAELMTVGHAEFEPFWKAAVNQEPLRCYTGKIYEGVSAPSLVVLDGFLFSWYSVIRTNTPATPILMWASITATGFNWICMPPELGGRPRNLLTPFTEEERRTGRAEEYTGNIIKMAGLPAMYDWEFTPQTPHLNLIAQKFEQLYIKAAYESDGILSCCALAFDGEATLSAIDAWSNAKGHPTFHVGPVLPFKEPGSTSFSLRAADGEKAAAPPGAADAVTLFLDRALKEKGEASVVYICFGTHFWPKENSQHLWTLLEALSERSIPFILSHSSPLAQIPEEIKQLYNNSQKGLIVPSTPQQTLMAHKAVGWFITHGGAGGTMDATAQGVPMIGWPFQADQPSNIAYLTHTADVAFELLEVRTGEHGLNTILATGKKATGTLDAFRVELEKLFNDMKGEPGLRKRANAKRRQADLAMAWTEGGPARVAFQRFCLQYGL